MRVPVRIWIEKGFDEWVLSRKPVPKAIARYKEYVRRGEELRGLKRHLLKVLRGSPLRGSSMMIYATAINDVIYQIDRRIEKGGVSDE